MSDGEASVRLDGGTRRIHPDDAAELARLRREVERLQNRLEIDHCYELVNGELVRKEIPPESRSKFPDGIECRDATIMLLERNREELQGRNNHLRTLVAELRAGLAPFVGESLCWCGKIPNPTMCPRCRAAELLARTETPT